MQVGDLVGCKVTKAANTLGVVTKIEEAAPPAIFDAVHVLTGEQVFRWSIARLEVISASR